MDAKKVLEIVQDISLWRGDVYSLAMQICDAQKEQDAKLCEDNGNQELAELIRGS